MSCSCGLLCLFLWRHTKVLVRPWFCNVGCSSDPASMRRGQHQTSWHSVQEVGESTPKASASSPNAAFTKRHSAAISELEPLAEEEEDEAEGITSEDPDAPEKGMPQPY